MSERPTRWSTDDIDPRVSRAARLFESGASLQGLSASELARVEAQVQARLRPRARVRWRPAYVLVALLVAGGAAAAIGGARGLWRPEKSKVSGPVSTEPPRPTELLPATIPSPPLDVQPQAPAAPAIAETTPERKPTRPPSSPRPERAPRNAPAVVPEEPAPPASKPENERLEQTRLLARALRLQRHEKDAAGALRLLDEWLQRYPEGMLVEEVEVARVEVLLTLRRPGEALEALARLDARPGARANPLKLRLLRARLLVSEGRCAEADGLLADLRKAGLAGEMEAQALYAHAACLSRLGRVEESRALLEDYLRRFPESERAAEVRRELGE